MKKITFDFVRSPLTRMKEVDAGLAPKESLLGYYWLLKNNFIVSDSSKRYSSKIHSYLRKFRHLENTLNLADLITWIKSDIIVIATRFSVKLAITGKLLGKKVVFYDSMQALPTSRTRIARVKLALYFSDQAVFFSENQLKEWCNTFPTLKKKGYAIPYGIDIDFFHTKKLHSVLKSSKLISVGRDNNRDFGLLAEYLKQNQDKNMLLVTQSYLLNDELKALPNITIRDGLSYQELASEYKSSFAAIIPIIKGTTHLSGIRAALEAMANGVLVIIARNESLEEYFVDRRHVLFYEPENVDSLQKTIQSAQSIELYTDIVSNAYSLVKTKYNVERMAKSLMETIN